jgi:hypothetical protein
MVDRTEALNRDGQRHFGTGEKQECELCEQLRQCIEQFGLTTCEPCQAEYLPSGGLLLY